MMGKNRPHLGAGFPFIRCVLFFWSGLIYTRLKPGKGAVKMDRRRLADVAAGRRPAELVLKNALVVHVFTGEMTQ